MANEPEKIEVKVYVNDDPTPTLVNLFLHKRKIRHLKKKLVQNNFFTLLKFLIYSNFQITSNGEKVRVHGSQILNQNEEIYVSTISNFLLLQFIIFVTVVAYYYYYYFLFILLLITIVIATKNSNFIQNLKDWIPI